LLPCRYLRDFTVPYPGRNFPTVRARYAGIAAQCALPLNRRLSRWGRGICRVSLRVSLFNSVNFASQQSPRECAMGVLVWTRCRMRRLDSASSPAFSSLRSMFFSGPLRNLACGHAVITIRSVFFVSPVTAGGGGGAINTRRNYAACLASLCPSSTRTFPVSVFEDRPTELLPQPNRSITVESFLPHQPR